MRSNQALHGVRARDSTIDSYYNAAPPLFPFSVKCRSAVQKCRRASISLPSSIDPQNQRMIFTIVYPGIGKFFKAKESFPHERRASSTPNASIARTENPGSSNNFPSRVLIARRSEVRLPIFANHFQFSLDCPNGDPKLPCDFFNLKTF